MDTLLRQGDHGVNSQGFPHAVTGQEELIQRALIRLTVPRGGFALDKELGSLLHTLGRVGGTDLSSLAFQYIRQALSGLEGVQVSAATCKRLGGGELEVKTELILGETAVVFTLPINY